MSCIGSDGWRLLDQPKKKKKIDQHMIPNKEEYVMLI